MMQSIWKRAAAWIERWMQPLAWLDSGYSPSQDSISQPGLDAQLEEILACVRREESKWNMRDRTRDISRRDRRET